MSKKIRRSVYYYQWEFLRRNKKYREDFESEHKYKKRVDWGKKYGVLGLPYDPTKSFDELLSVKPKGLFNFKQNFLLYPPVIKANLYGGRITVADISMEQELEWEAREDKDFFSDRNKILVVLVDLERKKKDILASFEHVISPWMENKKKGDRQRFVEYDDYLKIYDLVEAYKGNITKAAKKHYGNDSGGIDYAKQKVRRAYKKCKQLIEGGYRQIN